MIEWSHIWGWDDTIGFFLWILICYVIDWVGNAKKTDKPGNIREG